MTLIHWLVVSPPPKNMKVTWDNDVPNKYGKIKKCSKPPTSPLLIEVQNTVDFKPHISSIHGGFRTTRGWHRVDGSAALARSVALLCFVHRKSMGHMPIGSMVLVYMLTWLGYMAGKCYIMLPYIAAPRILWDVTYSWIRVCDGLLWKSCEHSRHVNQSTELDDGARWMGHDEPFSYSQWNRKYLGAKCGSFTAASIYEWRTTLLTTSYYPRWTWPKWVVPYIGCEGLYLHAICKNRVSVSGYRLWMFSHKFEHPMYTPHYFSLPLILSVTHMEVS